MCVCACVCGLRERENGEGPKGTSEQPGSYLIPLSTPRSASPALLSCHGSWELKRLAAGGDIARETDGHPTSPQEARSVGCIYFVVSSRHFGLAMGTANYYILFSHICVPD